MAEIVNYFDAGDPRAVIRRAVEELAGGKLVGLPFDTGYATCGSVTNEQRWHALRSSGTDESVWALACARVEEAMKFLAPLSPLQLRLVTRLWPGPVLMRVPQPDSRNPIDGLPMAIRSMVNPNGAVRLVVPESSLCCQVLEQVSSPLVFAACGSPHHTDEALQLDRLSGAELSVIIDAGPTLRRFPLTILDVRSDSWSVARPGALPERRIAAASCRHVLFVCTGNTCRSPMAERLFRKMLARQLKCSEEELLERGYAVSSAGLAAFDGAPASHESIELLRESGIDLADHHSRRADGHLLQHADDILTMTRMHRDTILQQYPQLAGRVRTVAPDSTDVADPIGGGLEDYRHCRDQLERFLEAFVTDFLDADAGGATS